MKIYFTASIHWRDKYGKYYQRIVKFLKKKGHEVIADHILYHKHEDILKESDEGKVEYYRTFINWVRSADVIVAEISSPSTVNIGHEISVALDMGKPVIAFYLKGEDPVMIKAIPSEKLKVVEYTTEDLEKQLEFELAEVGRITDHRFTMLLPPNIMSHLSELAERGKSRSEYIRDLIMKDMQKGKK